MVYRNRLKAVKIFLKDRVPLCEEKAPLWPTPTIVAASPSLSSPPLIPGTSSCPLPS